MRLDFLRYPEHLGPHLVEASPYLYNRIYKGEAPTRQRYKVRKVSLYDELVTSLCIEVAYGVHRMAKTGAIKLSEIMIPRAGRNDLSSLLATSVTNKEENMNGLQSVVILRPTKDNVVHIIYQKKLSRNRLLSRRFGEGKYGLSRFSFAGSNDDRLGENPIVQKEVEWWEDNRRKRKQGD